MDFSDVVVFASWSALATIIGIFSFCRFSGFSSCRGLTNYAHSSCNCTYCTSFVVALDACCTDGHKHTSYIYEIIIVFLEMLTIALAIYKKNQEFLLSLQGNAFMYVPYKIILYYKSFNKFYFSERCAHRYAPTV